MPTEPQDRRPKKTKKYVDPVFSFELDGETYTFKKATSDVVTPGWMRKHRNLRDDQQFFEILEALADEDTIDAVDVASQKDFGRIYNEFFEHLGADRGE
jgi:hypothetical protein